MNNDYKKIIFVAVMSLALAFLLVFAGLFKKTVNLNNAPAVSTPIANYEVNDSSWKTYKSEKFGIEFNYPPELFITEENQGTSENYDEMDLLFTNIENKSLISAATITKWKTTKPVFTPEEAGTFYEKLAFYSWYYFLENKNQIKAGRCSAEVQENLPDLPTLQEQTACEIQVKSAYIQITTNGQIIFYTSTLEITLPFEEKNEDTVSKIALSFRFSQ